MNSLFQPTRLRQLQSRIASASEQKEDPSTLLADAEDFNSICSEVVSRLECCFEIIESGRDLEALKLAEEEPRLAPLLDYVSFSGLESWRAFCVKGGLPEVPMIDATMAERLRKVYKDTGYAKRLYRKVKAAAVQGDREERLRGLRAILEFDANDHNARKQVEKIERGIAAEAYEKLKSALKHENEEEILSLIDQLESTRPPSDEDPLWIQALDARQQALGRQARKQSVIWLEEAEERRAEENWQEALSLLSRLDRSLDEADVSIPQECLSKHTSLSQWARDHETAHANEQTFKTAKADLESILSQCDNQAFDRSLSSIGQAEKAVRAHLHASTSSGHALPASLTKRSKKLLQEFDQQRRRHVLRRRLLMGSLATMTLLIVISAVGAIGVHMDARNYRAELLAAKESANSIQIASTLAQDDWRLGLVRRFSDRVKQDETELHNMLARANQRKEEFESKLAEMQNLRPSVEEERAELIARYKDCTKQFALPDLGAAAMCQDQARVISDKQSAIASHFKEETKKSFHQDMNGVVEKFNNLSPSDDSAVTALRDDIQRLSQWLTDDVPVLDLDIPDRDLLSNLNKQFVQQVASYQQVEDQKSAIAKAADLDAYLQALRAQDPRLLVKIAPSMEKAHEGMLGFPDLMPWAELNQVASANKRFPLEMSDPETNAFLNLRDDRMGALAKIYRYQVSRYPLPGQKRFSVFAQEKLKYARTPSKGGVLFDISGDVYDPRFQFGEVEFLAKKWQGWRRERQKLGVQDFKLPEAHQVNGIPWDVDRGKLTQESFLRQRLGIETWAGQSDDGKKCFDQTLLPKMDLIARDKAHPLCRAFLFLGTAKIMLDRPSVWQVPLTSLEKDEEVLRDLIARHYRDRVDSFDSVAWLGESRSSPGSKSLKAVFDRLARKSSYTDQVKKVQHLLSEGERDIRYLGHVDASGNPRLLAGTDPASAQSLWGHAQGEGGVTRLFTYNNKGDWQAEAAPEPWSPLYGIPKISDKSPLHPAAWDANAPKTKPCLAKP